MMMTELTVVACECLGCNMDTFNFTTGPTSVPQVGRLVYNGCTFGPLFESNVSSHVVKDAARRTVKYVEHTITVDGYVTKPAGDQTIDPTMDNLYKLLTAQGGSLIYSGRALDLAVNLPGGGGGGNVFANLKPPPPNPANDVAWGPAPELIEFQPLGGGLSAKVTWKVVVRLVPPATESVANSFGLLELNYETVVTYNEDGYSSLSTTGTIEIPMTRQPAQTSRTVPTTVDAFRSVLEKRILTGIDLSHFRITRRNFPVSRDKRTMEWDVQAEEKPYMDNPPDCTIARGSFSFRPAKAGPGLVLWLCTLRAAYTVRADRPRKTAWLAFLALLRIRMNSFKGNPTPINDEPPKRDLLDFGARIVGAGAGADLRLEVKAQKAQKDLNRRAWLIDFNGDEGVYQDSKTMTFSATWRLTSNFSHILLASGLWKKVPEQDANGDNLWGLSMQDVQGTESWLPNKLDPRLDIIVDFGSTGV